MARFRCYRCKPVFPHRYHEFEGDVPQCNQCGHAGVVELDDVHLSVLDENGPIVGHEGARQRIACMPKRDAMAFYPGDGFHASGDVRATTCRACLTTPAWMERAKLFRELQATIRIIEQGCCG